MTLQLDAPAKTVRGVLVDPPLGLVQIELGAESVEMQFSNAHVESFPQSAVRLLGVSDDAAFLDWGGAAISVQIKDAEAAAALYSGLERSGDQLEVPELRGHRLGVPFDLV